MPLFPGRMHTAIPPVRAILSQRRTSFEAVRRAPNVNLSRQRRTVDDSGVVKVGLLPASHPTMEGAPYRRRGTTKGGRTRRVAWQEEQRTSMTRMVERSGRWQTRTL